LRIVEGPGGQLRLVGSGFFGLPEIAVLAVRGAAGNEVYMILGGSQ